MNIYIAECYMPDGGKWVAQESFLEHECQAAVHYAEGRQHRAVRCGKRTEYWRVKQYSLCSPSGGSQLIWGPVDVAIPGVC